MDKTNNVQDKIIGAGEIALGGTVAYKGVASGLRRALGVRIEQHTTNIENAKNIIKKQLDFRSKIRWRGCIENFSCF